MFLKTRLHIKKFVRYSALGATGVVLYALYANPSSPIYHHTIGNSNGSDAESEDEEIHLTHWHFGVIRSVPWRSMSRLWGHIHSDYDLPVWLRRPVYLMWTWLYGCNLDEMEADDLRSFPNLNSFFTRALKKEARVVDPRALLVSPADARVLHFGPVDHKYVEQIKGITYPLDAFVGIGKYAVEKKEQSKQIPYYPSSNRLYHCVLYLAPGDYHRFHAPTEFTIQKLKHFAGDLYSVSPKMVQKIRGLFVMNERIVMLGQWQHGFFSMTAVGATNVGSISLTFDAALKTNRNIRLPENNEVVYEEKNVDEDAASLLRCAFRWHRGKYVKRGLELGQFNFGSTVVLIFEAPKEGVEFCIEAHDKVKMGQPLVCLST